MRIITMFADLIVWIQWSSLYIICLRPSRFIGFKKSNLCLVWKIMWVHKRNPWWPSNLHSNICTRTIDRVDVTLTLLQCAKPQLDALFISNILNPLFQDSLSLEPQPLRRWKGLTSQIILLLPHHWLYRSCTSSSSIQGPVVINFLLRAISILIR